jgi:hypothetical protein
VKKLLARRMIDLYFCCAYVSMLLVLIDAGSHFVNSFSVTGLWIFRFDLKPSLHLLSELL